VCDEPYKTFIENLKYRFSSWTKPGVMVQSTMAPSYKHLVPVKQPVVDAAVLILFFPKQNQPYFVLIKRTPDELSPHGGQVSLPGGKYETSDRDYLYTALRETSEEIGITPDLTEYLGALSSVIIPVSGYRVHPFVAYLNSQPQWSVNNSEVSYVIEVPLAELMDSKNVCQENIIYEGEEHTIPYFRLAGEKVWGATAMILAELKALAENSITPV